MRRTASRWIPFLLLACCTAIAAPLVAQSLEREVAESEARIRSLRSEQDALRSEMTVIRGRMNDIAAELRNIEAQVEAAGTLLTELDRQIDARTTLLRENTVALVTARERHAERQAVLSRRLRELYKRGPLPTAQLLLSAESFGELLNRYRYLLLVTRSDSRLAREVREVERDLTLREVELRSELLRVESARRQRESEYRNLEAAQRGRGTALANARSAEQTTAQRIRRLEQDEARLARLVSSLEAGVRPDGTVQAPEHPSLTPATRGTLDWPVEGRVVYRFGRTIQASGAQVIRSGIGIAAPEGTPVGAAAEGMVALAGDHEVILSHGDGYYTLYLFLRDVVLPEGSPVGRGDTIGRIDGTSTTYGPHIEFQIRGPGGETIDPVDWLRPR